MLTAVEHLKAARAALAADLARIEHELTIIDDTIARLSSQEGFTAPRPEDGVAAIEIKMPMAYRSVRDIVIDIVNRDGVVTLQEVVDAARLEGNPAKYESVSSVLSRLGREGIIAKGPRRGTYTLPPAVVGSVDHDDDVGTTNPPVADVGGGELP